MKRQIDWSTVLFNVREAGQEIDSLVNDIEAAQKSGFGDASLAKNDLNEARLAGALGHAYHHLNSSWRARFRAMPEADRTFDANEKWPVSEDFRRFWPRKVWGMLRGRFKQ